MKQCVICQKELKFINRPTFGMGKLSDGGEVCFTCYQEIKKMDPQVIKLKNFTKEDVLVILSGNKKSEEKDTNTDASPEKVDKDKNITVKDLKFPLLESYFTYETSMKMNEVSQIILPSGMYETESIFNGNTYFDSSVISVCDITGISASKNNNLFKFSASTFGVRINVCGDILITLIEMDKYDFRNKKELKKIKGDKDYILENYFRLLEEKPELFDASKVDISQLGKSKFEMKFPLSDDVISEDHNGGHNIHLPSGEIFNDLDYLNFGKSSCSLTGVDATPKNQILTISKGFTILELCGDMLVTILEMSDYDLTDKKDLKRVLNEKGKILSEYEKLVSEKPELFDASKIDLKKIEQSKKKAAAKAKKKAAPKAKKKAAPKAVKESLKIDYDKFNNKKTITSNNSIRHDMTDLFAGISTAMKSYTNILDVVSSAVQYLTLTPRYVETPNMGSLVIDLHYTGNDWIFFENGNLIFMADDTNYTFSPEGKTSDVHGGGKVDENLYYFIPINDYKSIAKSTKVEIQVSGRSIKVEFALEEKDINILDNFYTGIFEGDDPLVDIKSVQTTKEAAPQEKQQEQSQPKQVDIKSELKKYKEMLDDGLITQEDFDAKKKELLGL